MHDAVAEFSRRKPIDETVWQDFASRLHYVSGQVRGPGELPEAARRSSRSSTRPTARAATASTTSPIPPSAFRIVNDNLAKAGLVARSGRPDAGTRASSSRSPSAATSRAATRSTPSFTACFARAADLPHRPLPRQGDGAEPRGAALRQRHLRAASGTGTTSTTCRSRSPRTSASRAAASSTRRPGRRATSSRTTSCSS